MPSSIQYFQLPPECPLPSISKFKPFRAVIVIEEPCSENWQNLVSAWLVQSGCLYMMAWGINCSTWDDSVDLANVDRFNFEDIPEEEFVMTTWHSKEPLKEVLWFSKNLAFHSSVELPHTLILHISSINRQANILADYEAV